MLKPINYMLHILYITVYHLPNRNKHVSHHNDQSLFFITVTLQSHGNPGVQKKNLFFVDALEDHQKSDSDESAPENLCFHKPLKN